MECFVLCGGGVKLWYRKCNSFLFDYDGILCDFMEVNESVICNEVNCFSKLI